MKVLSDFENKILHGDCIEIMKSLPDSCIDLIVTSPPYNCGIKYENYNDNIGWKEYYEWVKLWIQEFYRIIKSDGRVCIVHYLSLGNSDERHAPLMNINKISEDSGFKHYGLAIWWDITLTKRTAWGSWLSASAPYINSPFEGILILYKEKWKKLNNGKTDISKEEFMESCSGIWKIPTERNRFHPAPFPKELASRIIRLLSYEGDIVLDNFCGSGTTLLAAKESNRKFIGIEKSRKYIEMSERRLSQEYLFDTQSKGER